MLCMQKKTLDLIKETGNHYIVCFKKNVGKFYNTIKINTAQHDYFKSHFDKIEMNRGRIEYRHLTVFKASPEVQAEYPHCKSVIYIKRERLNKNKESQENHYHLSDLELSAEDFMKRIRGHWSIENKLHWVKDVVMNEDKANLKNKQIGSILSLLRSFVISLASIFSKSLTNFQREYAHNIDLAYIF